MSTNTRADVSEVLVFENTRLFQALTTEDASTVAKCVLSLINQGRDVSIQDLRGRTLLHHVAERSRTFSHPCALPVVYQLCLRCQIDVDGTDDAGETCLHVLCRQHGAPYNVLVAFLRCGVDPLLSNNKGETAKDVLLQTKPQGWEMLFYWFEMYNPGLKHVINGLQTDLTKLERLLNFWCRSKIPVRKGDKVEQVDWLAPYVKLCAKEVRDSLKAKAETNEMVIAALAGDGGMLERIIKTAGKSSNVDVNTKDFSYRKDIANPITPQPLVMAACSAGFEDVVKVLLEGGADVNCRVCVIRDGSHVLQPLFFQVIRQDVAVSKKVLTVVLESADMAAKDSDGETVLYEAMRHQKSVAFVNLLLNFGMDISSRNKNGRTARDLATGEGWVKYADCIDNFVFRKIFRQDGTCYLTRLILNGYDHILDLKNESGATVLDKAMEKRRKDLVDLLDSIPVTLERARVIQQASVDGDIENYQTFATDDIVMSRDRGGRTVLHLAILGENVDLVKYILVASPSLVNQVDNMERTPLHYAYLLLDSSDVIDLIQKAGGKDSALDVYKNRADYYKKTECGTYVHGQLVKEVCEFDLRMYLQNSAFESRLYRAIQNHDLGLVNDLVLEVAPHCGMDRFSFLLFDCLECGADDIAVELIKCGCKVDIWKQMNKQSCMKHTMGSDIAVGKNVQQKTSLKQRAQQLGFDKVSDVINRYSHEGSIDTFSPESLEQMQHFHL